MRLRYTNTAVCLLWSLTYLIFNNIYIEENTTTRCKTDLQKPEFASCYQTVQLRWELYNRKCGEGLTEREG